VFEREFSSGGIVIRRSGEGIYVLLIKDGYGHWTWPKGHLDKNETPQEAAAREIKEEAGIADLDLLAKVGQTQYFYRLNGALRFKTVHLYLFETREVALKIQKSEIDSGEWLSPRDALERIEYRGSGKLLKKAIDKFSVIKKVL